MAGSRWRSDRDAELDDLPAVSGDAGYRAGARLRQRGSRRTRLTIAGLAAVVVAGFGFAVVDRVRPDGSRADAGPTNAAAPGTSGPSPDAGLPRLALYGELPPPVRRIPVEFGWLQWLDTARATFGGQAGLVSTDPRPLAFADTIGRAIEVCPAFGDFRQLPDELDLCLFDDTGHLLHRVSVADLSGVDATTPLPGGSAIGYDATVSGDGAWLWLATSIRRPHAWSVDVSRVDLALDLVRGRRHVLTLPIAAAGTAASRTSAWTVESGEVVRPVVRATPDGGIVAITVASSLGGSAGRVTEERIVLPGSLDPTKPAIDALLPAEHLGPECVPGRAGFDRTGVYVSVCERSLGGGRVQPYVRTEADGSGVDGPAGATSRDIDLGPPAGAGDVDTWLLDVDAGVVDRWSPALGTLSSLDLATGSARTTLPGAPDPTAGPIRVPEYGVLGDGSIVWAAMSAPAAPLDGRAAAGTADGRYLFLLEPAAPVPCPPSCPGTVAATATILVVLAATGQVVGRWDAPGPITQLAMAPGGRALVALAAPGGGSGPAPVWLLDPATGTTVEVLGRLEAIGGTLPSLLAPALGILDGF